MGRELIKTTDLGKDWFVNQWSDGSITFRNTEIGIRIDLPVESADLLSEICKAAKAKAHS